MGIEPHITPNRANAGGHWRNGKRKRADYFLRCLCTDWKQPRKPHSHVRLTATLYVWSRMDMDNLMARMKWPLDWLVRNGWLTDDGPDVIEWELPRQVVDRKNQRIEIELEEL